MRIFIVAFIGIAIAIACAPVLYAADSVEGFWKSIDEKNGKVTAYWKIWVEGTELKGTILKVPGQSDSTICDKCKKDSAMFLNKPIIGTIWMWGLKKDGDKWTKGKIVDCATGTVYWASVTVTNGGKNMELNASFDSSGFIGRKQNWMKSSEEEAIAVQ